MADDFQTVQEDARELEKKSLEYKTYDGDMHVAIAVDFSPKEMIDYTYQDLVNLYQRTQKIISAQSMQIYGTGKAPKAASTESSAKSEEVESNIRQMSTETKEMADKIGEEMKKDEKAAAEGTAPPPPPKAPEKSQTIEFESISAEEKKVAGEEEAHEEAPQEIELEKPPGEKTAEVELEREAEPEEEEAAPPLDEEAPAPIEKIEKKVMIAIPPALTETPDEAAEKKFDKMEEQVRGALGEKVDEAGLKKKMLELTKQLFKEKSVNRREEIKAEITVLKNMLSGKSMKGMPAKGKRVTKTMARTQLLETMVGSQRSEIASTKDKIVKPFREQLAGARNNFYRAVEEEKDASKKKEMYESFVFTLTSLSEQIPGVVEKYDEFITQKHLAELDKLQETAAKDSALKLKIDKRRKEIKSKYADEFSAIKSILTKEIDNSIEAAGREAFPEPEKGKGAKSQEVVFEINEMDDGTLLYYLHSQDKDYYKKYERKLVSKAEALLRAKELMAKEKGLSDATVRKYFSKSEG